MVFGAIRSRIRKIDVRVHRDKGGATRRKWPKRGAPILDDLRNRRVGPLVITDFAR
jgi:hypothetical protein